MRLLILFFCFSSLAFGQSEQYKDMLKKYYNDFPLVYPKEVKAKLGNIDLFLLDTRESKEYQVSHLQNAILVGYDNFNLDKLKNIPKDAEIIVYCSVGARSQNVGEKLIKAGYSNVNNLYGGLFHWMNLKYPIVDENGPTTNIHGYSREWGQWIHHGKIIY